MKKRISLVAIAVVCAFALCLAIVPAFAAPVTYEKIENVAAGKIVIANFGNNTQALVDGVFGNDDADGWYAEPSEGSVTVRIVLDQPTSIDTVKLFPANSATIPDTAVFPYAYTIEVKVGEDWVEVASDADVDLLYEGDDTVCKSYTFAPKTASEVRVTITDYFADDAGAWIAISEIQVFNAPASVAGLINAATTANGATITATKSMEANNFVLANLIDGAPSSEASGYGWHDPMDGTAPSEIAPWNIDIALGDAYEVEVIRIYPVNFYMGESVMPSAFELQLSDDNGATWETVATATNVVSHIAGEGGNAGLPAENNPLTFVLDEATEVTNFRMVIQAPGNFVNAGAHYTCIGDIELWAEPLPEPETTAPVETDPETEAESTVESEIESDDESLNETVAETEAPKAETEAPKAETNAPETAAPAADTADEGCASVVGISAVAVLAAAAAAVVLKKKD